MQVLSRDSLPLGGFAGLTEHRLVTDSRIFGTRKQPNTFEGLGQFVYLADANFNPLGETGMHPHKEIDVISVMIDGQVSHQGSLEHGKSLVAGDVQVQRAGGEGFAHNEINPDLIKNRMLQIWALPEQPGKPAGYKHYQPKSHGTTRIYGGSANQTETFDSTTYIDVVRLQKGDTFESKPETMAYVSNGAVEVTDKANSIIASDGTLVKGEKLGFSAVDDSQIIVIYKL